ncbi:hypothetical protein [Mesorhizobium sp.]|uniref:hypothetical protein n=1 Tax=Mesorhizobium sp. TaxID=1871066 RepID=UPI0025E7673C|nr:hypothetical protein [Mesorhizobium sp.]
MPTIKHKLWRKDLLWRVLREDVDICDHWRRLAYAAAHPGCSEARATLMQAVAEKIFFAGAHVAGPLTQALLRRDIVRRKRGQAGRRPARDEIETERRPATGVWALPNFVDLFPAVR